MLRRELVQGSGTDLKGAATLEAAYDEVMPSEEQYFFAIGYSAISSYYKR